MTQTQAKPETEVDTIRLSQEIYERDRKGCYALIKRIWDILFSACGLVFLMPVLLIVALVIYCDDPYGSPLFVQTRVGKGGREFRFFKFRTMVVDAEKRLEELMAQNEVEGNAFKIKNDPRITRVGKFLRQTGLDELPQLWNVLKGDMSIVGPRPPLPNEVKNYSDFERQRLMITPGLTCYWQTQPDRNGLPFRAWVELDLKYIHERSVLVDLKILAKTILVVLRREGH